MANHKSAIKRHRQSLRKRARNRTVRSSTRTAVKNFEKSLAESADGVTSKELFLLAEKRLQSAVSKGVMKKKTMGRKVSRLAKALKVASEKA